MTDTELLQALAGMIDQKLDPIHERLDKIEVRMDNLEQQIYSVERNLKDEIKKSGEMVLTEVERVHNILDIHKNDKTKHTA